MRRLTLCVESLDAVERLRDRLRVELVNTLDQVAERRSQATVQILAQLERAGLAQQAVEAVAGPRVKIAGRWVLNFAATNYLGLDAGPSVGRAMARAVATYGISLATPRLLATDPLTTQLEAMIARLVRQDVALVFPSTTHAARDLLALLSGSAGIIFVDTWAYPISREAARSVAGSRVWEFAHNDCAALARALRVNEKTRDKVIVCDGIYAADGQPAPLREMAAIADLFGAVVYVDDAHGIGLLGEHPTKLMPYGVGGGGTPAHLRVPAGNFAHVGSLSKAFGVPLAFVAGPAAFIAHLRSTAPSFVHTSPAPIPSLAAALTALRLNGVVGDTLRRRLVDRVRQFRAGLAQLGVSTDEGSLFPVQMVKFPTAATAVGVANRLRRAGVWTVVQLWFWRRNHALLGTPDLPASLARILPVEVHLFRPAPESGKRPIWAWIRSKGEPRRAGGECATRRGDLSAESHCWIKRT